MRQQSYEFQGFQLDPAARELWQDGQLVDLPRRTFDGLVFLVEQRDRAVSRDELIAALWGRPVEDIQVTQLVMRLRRLLGDDSSEPRFIRAIPGFGYRWIAELEPAAGPAPEGGAAGGDPQPEPPPAADRRQVGPVRGRWPSHMPWILTALLVALAAWLTLDRPGTEQVLTREPGEAIVVLPLAIPDRAQTDIAWARLGAMDLIAEQLRDAGLPVPPSENVITVLQTLAGLPDEQAQATLRQTLSADILVRGTVRPAAGGWIVELVAASGYGQQRRVESGAGDLLPASRQAAGLLLAALGYPAPAQVEDGEAWNERLRRARAAGLALELDTARAILTEAPDELRDQPELRHELAWIEMRAGRPEAVMAITTELLADSRVLARPRLHAQVLIAHGVALVNQAGGWAVGEPHFDAAVAVLDGEPWAPELGRALTIRSAARTVLQRFDAAARDLGRARTLFETGGDRLGMAQVENYSGNLELERGRPADALVHFRNALAIDPGHSQVDAARANFSAMQRAQMQLLHWSDALATSGRLWQLRDRFQEPVDPHRLHSLAMHRVEVLIAQGQHQQAEAILEQYAPLDAQLPEHGRGYELELRARLAWQSGDAARAFELTGRTLALSLAKSRPASRQPVELALLHQRASIAAGTGVAAETLLPDLPKLEEHPVWRVAKAEWAAFQDRSQDAEVHFRAAALAAEARAVPSLYVMVADAYARWLLRQARIAEAIAVAGRVARWADEDYDAALLQLQVLHASDRQEAWLLALVRAQGLAGERIVPAHLTRFPGTGP